LEEQRGEAVLEERISLLTPVEREIMEFCSLIPHGFTKEEIFSFRPYPFLEKTLSRLEEMNFFLPRSKGVFIFLQPWKNLVYAKIPEFKARSIHTFLARRAVETKKSNFEIAFHFSLSQEPERGIPFAFQSAREFKEKFAFEDSLSILQRYSSLIPRVQSQRQRFEFFSLRGELHFLTQNFARCVQDFKRALCLAPSFLEKNLGALMLAVAYYRSEQYQEAIRVLEENKIFLQKQAEAPEIKYLLIQNNFQLAKSMWFTGRRAEAGHLLQASLILTKGLDEELEAEGKQILGFYLLKCGERKKGKKLLEESLQFFLKKRNWQEVGLIQTYLAFIERERGNWTASLKFLKVSYQSFSKVKNFCSLAKISSDIGQHFLYKEDLPRAEEWLKRCLSFFSQIKNPLVVSLDPLGLNKATINLRVWKRAELFSSWIHTSPSALKEKEGYYLKEDKSLPHLGRIPQPPSLLGKLLDLILEEIPSERALALLVDEEGEVVFQESRPISKVDNWDITKDIIRKAIEGENPILINDLKTDARFKNDKNALTFDSKKVLCLPLIIEDRAAGALYLDRRDGFEPFSPENLEFLVAISKPIRLILRGSSEFKGLKERTFGGSKGPLIGQSKAFRRILNLINRVKDNNAPVFICGESGTGKELVARAIHFRGARKKGKFVVVNCGAIPEHLLEAELFGFVKGAFTGAFRDKQGLIEEADGGTFFLDEIGDLSLHLQSKLLRLLQEKEVRKIGENIIHYVDVRIISATNKNIEKEIKRQNFREDLYYRIKIISIEIPPLRERKDDLLLLLNHFVGKYSQEMKRERAYFSPRALELLMEYQWPGNVRELQNEIQRCLIFAGEDNFIREEHISSDINPKKETYSLSSHNFFKAKAEFEKRFLNQALVRCNRNKVKTAEEIGLTRQGLFRLMKKHKILKKEKI